MRTRRATVAAAVVVGLWISACGGSDEVIVPVPADSVDEAGPADAAPAATDTTPSTDVAVAAEDVQMFPDVIGATAVQEGTTWTFSATLSSPYDTPERYADAWRVVGPDGTVLGERILNHDHATEQPFTRSESGIEIPDDVATVTIEGRDLQFGYGGDTFELTLGR